MMGEKHLKVIVCFLGKALAKPERQALATSILLGLSKADVLFGSSYVHIQFAFFALAHSALMLQIRTVNFLIGL